MNKKNKTVTGIFIALLILAVISMYAPVLFTAPQIVPANAPQSNQSADLSQQTPGVAGIEVSTTPATTNQSLQGFQGLDQESKSLNLGK